MENATTRMMEPEQSFVLIEDVVLKFWTRTDLILDMFCRQFLCESDPIPV